MASTAIPARPGRSAAAVMLWLPGAYHTHRDFLAAGFAEGPRSRGIDLDLVFADLDMEFMGDRRILSRLRAEFVLPARESGAQVWLGGISLGGLFALDYAGTFPDEIHGLCLLAPYLGNRMLVAEISARGVAGWQPGPLADEDVERRIWRRLKERSSGAGVLYVGCGRQDRFAAAHALMAQALPAASLEVIEGGHDWPTWSRLWESFLDSRFA